MMRQAKRHSWRNLKGTVDRCARRKCKAQRKPGGQRYLYKIAGAEWDGAVPACTGEPTSDR